ncbi:hypothetical protein I312_105804 [Cryptococcus bacillisporus CA1280]|uniref:uncharacterized protein n=1 Tax=Cryptococcus bacillisporus CA1280 TaxID=1296109 RepID=UPI0033689A5B
MTSWRSSDSLGYALCYSLLGPWSHDLDGVLGYLCLCIGSAATGFKLSSTLFNRISSITNELLTEQRAFCV